LDVQRLCQTLNKNPIGRIVAGRTTAAFRVPEVLFPHSYHMGDKRLTGVSHPSLFFLPKLTSAFQEESIHDL
jgi:hypothetical protein